jgi:uncharacterized protein YqhQ
LSEKPLTEDPEEIKRWKWANRKAKKANSEMHALRCDTELILSVISLHSWLFSDVAVYLVPHFFSLTRLKLTDVTPSLQWYQWCCQLMMLKYGYFFWVNVKTWILRFFQLKGYLNPYRSSFLFLMKFCLPIKNIGKLNVQLALVMQLNLQTT